MNRRQFVSLISASALTYFLPISRSKETFYVIDVARQEINVYDRYRKVVKVTPHTMRLV